MKHRTSSSGADGNWSKVRSAALQTTNPNTSVRRSSKHICLTRTSGILSRRRRSATRNSFALAPGQGIFAHREAGAVLHAYVALSRPEDWFGGIDFSDAVAATGRIVAEFEGWAPAQLDYGPGRPRRSTADAPALPTDHQ